MTLSTAAILKLAMQCAPNVAPATVAAIVATESEGKPFAINVNRGPIVGRLTDAVEAAAVARRYVAAGYSVDLGLGQINSRNMRRLGLAWHSVFDPCVNIAALGRVLTENYQAALIDAKPQIALRIALSRYNTGSASRGFHNGYVGRVLDKAGVSDGAGKATAVSTTTAQDPLMPIATPARPPARDSVPPAWSAFARSAYERRTAPDIHSNGSKSVWSD